MAFFVEWCYQSLSPVGRNCSCVQRGLEYSGEHWGNFLCYHNQKSSPYVVRSRSLVWFKELVDTWGRSDDGFSWMEFYFVLY